MELDACSPWAVFRGNEHQLTIIENTLEMYISQDVEHRCEHQLRPWVRSRARGDVLYVLSGMLPICWPGTNFPRIWDAGQAELDKRLGMLSSWGWRRYQLRAVREACIAQLGRGIVSVCCGGGKTRIAWGIAFCCGGTWQYVVYGRDIVRQAADAFNALSSRYMPDGTQVDIQAWSWSKLPLWGAGVLVDECHQAAAKNRSKKLLEGRWGWRVGLSGSVFDRTDGRNLLTAGFFSKVVAEVSNMELVEEGHLSLGKVHIVHF